MSNHLPMIEAGARACLADVSPGASWDSMDESARGPWLRLSMAAVEYAAAAMKSGEEPQDAAALGLFITANRVPAEDRVATAEAWEKFPAKTRRPWEQSADAILTAARSQVRAGGTA